LPTDVSFVIVVVGTMFRYRALTLLWQSERPQSIVTETAPAPSFRRSGKSATLAGPDQNIGHPTETTKLGGPRHQPSTKTWSAYLKGKWPRSLHWPSAERADLFFLFAVEVNTALQRLSLLPLPNTRSANGFRAQVSRIAGKSSAPTGGTGRFAGFRPDQSRGSLVTPMNPAKGQASRPLPAIGRSHQQEHEMSIKNVQNVVQRTPRSGGRTF